jgi:hypothetical protein
MRVLDFDIENRPLSYWYDGQTTAELTGFAMCWADDPESMEVYLLGRDDMDYALARFVEAYNEADMVTGHYIRRHDLPHINSELMERGMAPLGEKLTCDTKLDFVKKGDQPATQEYLAEMFGVESPKESMSQHDWRKANRLTSDGVARTKVRCVGDVKQHMELRLAMLKAGVLHEPKVWRS